MGEILPLLIVGGGPVGLALAIDLGWRGVGATLIDQGLPQARLDHPRMDNVGIRSMEYCRRWGISDAVREAGFPRDLPLGIRYATGVLGHILARDDYPAQREAVPPPFSPEKHELCPQNFFDPVLQRAATGYDCNRILFGHRLTALTQHDDHVEAVVEQAESDDSLILRARYVAACDGAGSTVAALAGAAPRADTLLSYSTNIFICCPDIAARTQGDRAYRYILTDQQGVWGSMVNIDGRDVWRLQILGDSRKSEWPEAEIDALVRKGIGADLPYDLLSVVPWARRAYVADHFRIGRCFLVGDAAHQLSPTGGYGMNTGIAEAADLSWKIAAVAQGWGGDALLGSYDAERRPAAVRAVRQASDNLAAMRRESPAADLFGTSAAAQAGREETGLRIQAAMQKEWRSFGIHLGNVYAGSPLIADDDEPAWDQPDAARFEQTARPGARAPHVWIAPGRSILDLFGDGFVLLDFGGDTDAAPDMMLMAARRIALPLRIERIESAEAHALYARRYVLVRPDGHVAWRGDALPADPSRLLDRVRGAEGCAQPRDIISEAAE